MNIRQAFLEAARHIELNTNEFSFGSCHMPDCGTPGCAVGWVCHFMGYGTPQQHIGHGENSPFERFNIASGMRPYDRGSEFYSRMSEFDNSWLANAKQCAAAMRLYADKYHPAESRALIPESVARIFRMTHAELSREIENA